MLDAENRNLANPSSMDFLAVAGGIEDHASNLPLAASKALQIVDNLRYMIGIELIHAAQAVDLRAQPSLGRVTSSVYRGFRETVPFYSEDRNISVDIQKAYSFVSSGQMIRIINDSL